MSTETTPEKQRRERSKAYPGANLEECAEYVRLIKINLGKGVHDRDSLAKAMGYDKASGAVNPKIAALVHFGFLQRAPGGYALTPNAARITDPLNEEEKKEELRTAFERPTLYQELLEKFAAEGQIPVQLATHLHRFHGITAASSNSAAQTFLESGRYAGMLDADGKIVAEGATATSPTPSPAEASSLQNNATPLVGNGDYEQPTLAEPKKSTRVSTQRFEFAISDGRTATISVPAELNERDIKIIKKQIELLELQAGVEGNPT
jgi:hypothetical protein